MKTDFTLVYDLIPSPIGEVGIVRCLKGVRPVRMIFLPHKDVSTNERILETFPAAAPSSGKRGKTGMQIDGLPGGRLPLIFRSPSWILRAAANSNGASCWRSIRSHEAAS